MTAYNYQNATGTYKKKERIEEKIKKFSTQIFSETQITMFVLENKISNKSCISLFKKHNDFYDFYVY